MSDRDGVVIVPRRGRSERALPAAALLVFTPQDVQILRALDPKRLTKIQKVFLSDLQLWDGGCGAVAVAGPLLGAPQAALVLEKLIVLGASRIVALGWCGALDAKLALGDVVLPQWAVPEEGTSPHYPVSPENLTPDSVLAQRVSSLLTEAGVFVVHSGGVWSMDAPYRETLKKVARYQRDGVLAVEMECSALFAVARYRGVALSACLVVSDDLSGPAWRHGYTDRRFLETRKRLIPLLLDALLGGANA